MEEITNKVSVAREKVKAQLGGFMNFVREQGVVGLAVGFILGGAVSKMVASVVSDIVNPLLGLILGVAGDFRSATFNIGPSRIAWGSFVSTVVDFVVIALVVYYGVRILGLDKLDKKK